MLRISPSVLNADQGNLQSEVERVAGDADFIHLDVMDGKFVPNFTYGFDETIDIVRSSVLPIDLHLMVEDADLLGPKYADFRDDGVFSVTVHFEAVRDLKRTIAAIAERGVRVGVALKPATPASVIADYIESVDMVLVMTVEPGFGGQSFMPEMMSKVREIRRLFEINGRNFCWLQVDGGIGLSTIGEAALSGADTFVAGSAVYKSGDPAATVRELRVRAEEAIKYTR